MEGEELGLGLPMHSTVSAGGGGAGFEAIPSTTLSTPLLAC